MGGYSAVVLPFSTATNMLAKKPLNHGVVHGKSYHLVRLFIGLLIFRITGMADGQYDYDDQTNCYVADATAGAEYIQQVDDRVEK